MVDDDGNDLDRIGFIDEDRDSELMTCTCESKEGISRDDRFASKITIRRFV